MHPSFPGLVLRCRSCGELTCDCSEGLASSETLFAADDLLGVVKVWIRPDGSIEDIFTDAMETFRLLEGVFD